MLYSLVKNMIALNSPVKPDLKKLSSYLEQVNNIGWYTNFGPLHQKLTERLEEYLGIKNLLLMSNGTLALQVAYEVLGVKSALTTPFSFVATSSSALWQNIPLSFSDINPKSYNLCSTQAQKALEKNSEIDTVIATHVYGNPCDVQAFEKLSENMGVKIIYDAAHAFGVKVGSESILNFGDASILSFHATKVYHTVEGGAVVFKQHENYERAKELINFAIGKNGIDGIGINAKMNEYQAAVGLVLLDDIALILEHREALFTAYREGLKDVVGLPEWHLDSSFNGAYMPIYLDSEEKLFRVIEHLSKQGIQNRRYFYPSLDTVFSQCVNFGCSNSHQAAEGMICLPLHYNMTLSDVGYILNEIKGVI